VLLGFERLTSSLTDSAELVHAEGLGIKAEIHEALVQLQFQDRVSQVMSHVRTSIDSLPRVIEEHRVACERDGGLIALDPAGLLGELEGSYAMADEHVVHRQGEAEPATRTGTAVTFF
jgi:methyl-accepting chemotaxis protein